MKGRNGSNLAEEAEGGLLFLSDQSILRSYQMKPVD